MYKLTKLALDKINNYDFYDTKYLLCDRILYDVTNKYYTNAKKDEIVAKLMIIGRTYSASLERVQEKNLKVDYYSVADEIINKNIDDEINKLQNMPLNEDVLVNVLKIHKKLMVIFENYTKLDKRSLASKYLHFHLPEIVFIYDSRVSSIIGRFVNGRYDYKTELLNRKIDLSEIDDIYANYCYKAKIIYDNLTNQNFNKETLPRYVDRILLRYCDEIGR